eukprot:Unigene5984_Nuclearia_a/m.18331 Unigene5984_Nuclearia_a/g.18331  ORF Unigene5984_Nuclearia_a/g.18331 Unigene5984_Nuclearia_a/m.18331 type:complete len:639 (-) Unigene5984_Nuclearia_a:25-1941(-)
MIEHVTVFSKGGLVLWAHSLARDRDFAAPVNELVRQVLLEERSARAEFETDKYGLRWAFDNALDLVYVVVYNKGIAPPYTGELLTQCAAAFSSTFAASVKDAPELRQFDFDAAFGRLLGELQQKAQQPARQRTFEEVKRSKSGTDAGKAAAAAAAPAPTSPKFEPTSPKTDPLAEPTSPRELTKEEIERRLKEKGRLGSGKATKVTKEPEALEPVVKQPKKMAESKKDGPLTRKAMSALDFSNAAGEGAPAGTVAEQFIDHAALASIRARAGAGDAYDVGDLEATAEDDGDDDAHPAKDAGPAGPPAASASASASSSNASIFGFFKGLVGQKVLERADLEPALTAMKEHLINKNVAKDISDSLCASVRESLIGQKVSSFKGLNALVKESMEPALQRILTPKKSTDLLRDILAAKAERRPFSIVFCGVNGVGKSTNLAKICFWLLQNKLRVLIAACDTFRSGAVEQLRVHVRNLKSLDLDGQGSASTNIELYEKGYGKEPALIASDAISYARSQKFDVVLVDTAGRMQDNAPLMQALASLVRVNNPDKVVFVGEALVGNDGVDQLVKFNAALKDYSNVAEPRQIDGIVLTKFDTIDDKVGAALSMTYITGQPILFVGTGQTYTDLKKMNVKAVVQALLR